MYVINQNVPAELKIDFEKIFSAVYFAKYTKGTESLKRRQDVRMCSTHIKVWAAPPPWVP